MKAGERRGVLKWTKRNKTKTAADPNATDCRKPTKSSLKAIAAL
jgi:hypothetical protein